MTELPKWPGLLVVGAPVTEAQADEILIRTTCLHSLSCNDEAWNRVVMRTLGIEHSEDGLPDFDSASEAAQRLGVLNLRHLDNKQIASPPALGPHGWCDWSGSVFAADLPLGGKWPTVEEVAKEWRLIAEAFPYLRLTAQLVRHIWDECSGDVVEYRPLVRWRVAEGRVWREEDPGDLICRPVEEDVETQVRRMMRPGSERGVTWARLRTAVERCMHA